MIHSERLSDTDYRLVFEGTPELHLVLRPDFTIVAASNAYLAVRGMRREDVLGRGLFHVFSDSAAPGMRNLRASLERVLRTRRPDAMETEKYGSDARHWSPVNAPILDGIGKILYIIHRIEDVSDVVHLKRAGREHTRMTRRLGLRVHTIEAEIGERVQQLQQANDQLRAANQALAQYQTAIGESRGSDILGQLTSTVAHDFNDLMTVIAGSLSVVEEVAGTRSELQRLAGTVQRAIERGSSLTSQLLAFGRAHTPSPEIVDLNDLLRNFRALAEPAADAAAATRSEPAPPGGIDGARGTSTAPIRDAGAPARPTHAKAASAPKGTGRILVVEDDPDVLDTVVASVTKLGYRTVAARDGDEALAMLDGPEPLDLLFTDIAMRKGMNGIQLAHRARELHPNLRVLLTSGCGFPDSADIANQRFPILRKPYQGTTLAEALRHVLAA
jgi:PAS domain S-box-containing protein